MQRTPLAQTPHQAVPELQEISVLVTQYNFETQTIFHCSYAFWFAHLGYKSEWALWKKEYILCFWKPVAELELNQLNMGRHEQNMTEDWDLADREFSLKKGAMKARSHTARWNPQCEKQEIQQFSHPAVQPSSCVEEKCNQTVQHLWLNSEVKETVDVKYDLYLFLYGCNWQLWGHTGSGRQKV